MDADRSADDQLNYQPFSLFVSSLPQSGSSKIVFASNREGSRQIYVMNGDGSAVTRLTYSGANDDYPRWSPDGTRILFQSDRDHPDTGYNDIYVMNSDGSGVTRLSTDANDDSMASWSPDGSKVVFQSLRNGVNYQVYSMNADGSSQVCLTNTSSTDSEPSWSPNGAKIAFASDRDHAGTSSVYVMNGNGTGQQRLTFSAATFDDRQPCWSRDGAKIAFVSTRDSVSETWTETDDYEIPEDDGQTFPRSRLHINKEIYVMNADGSSQLRLTNDLANDDAPSWSPDGNRIVFHSDRERDCCDPSAQIWTMNADGSGQTDVSNDGASNYMASWASGSGNQLPIANAGGAYSGTISQNVPFHGNNSYDPDGSIVSYSWNFGDGGSSSGINPTHAYTANGTYTVTLTVTDNLGAQASAQTTANISTSSSDQFAQNFLYWGLGRTPNGDESGYWSDIIRAAYPQGQTSMLMAMKEFGFTVFESQEYAQRGRNNHDYVYDLYKTYLMRDPDQEGWNFWTSVCDSYGRGAVRQAFDETDEFHDIVASLSASGNPSSAVASLATAQVDPFNQSGNPIQARDCEWSAPLISLPGRAGLDLGLSLSYSSLIWTRSGPYAYFDQDYESLSSGFTIGFPTIQWRKFDAQTGRNVYIFAAAGHHVELRQVGSTDIYEAADSSYLQLIDYGGSLALRTTDGTELSFTPLLYGYNVTQIKDRNGNFITVENDWRGDVQHVTDTVGRTLNFIYDSNANLIRIEQAWTGQSQPHVWASFGWGSTQMQTNFGEVVGTYAGENILTLNFVGFDDGSYTRFNYNGYAQVREIKHFASDSNPNSDSHLLNTTVYNYGASDDPTRLTDMRVSAESWTGINDVPSQVITQFSASGDAHQMITPDGTTYKEFYGGTGSSPAWQHGLVVATQVLTGGSTVQKTTTSAWTQDDPNASYQTNPRVYQTDVSDGTNHRKTTIGYQTFTLPTTNASCSLPNEVYEYAADQTNVLRRTHTDYGLTTNNNYINDYRRLIALPTAKLLYEGTSTLRSKTTFIYDQGEFMQNTVSPAIQHDEYSYSTGFVVGRGNVTRVIRWDVDDPNQTAKTENKVGYDITGNVVFTRDALDHQTSMSFADAFSIDGTSLDTPRSFATFAYPTIITDADGFSSSLWYRYDFGAKTRVQGPPPQGQSSGAIQALSYDSAARVQQVTTLNNNAYTRYIYGPTYVQSLATVNNLADEAYTGQFADGLGRTVAVTHNHPGSQGGYNAVLIVYDKMGRAIQQSNPTEITGAGVPTGDDAGYQFNVPNTFDWKGRPLRIYNMDGTYKEASYDGCGCAGGEVVTLEDEMDRQQKVYSDVLGRHWKTEVWTWPDGNNNRALYSTSVSVLNARDQVKLVNQYAGAAPTDASSTNEAVACPTGTCQQTTMAYDGFARLHSKHVPEQRDQSNNPTYTTWTYKPDDTIESVTDGRGANATYIYNNYRHLVNEIQYSAPSGITPTSNVSLGYDAAGNRISMSDGAVNSSYSYDSLSRMISETRQFSGTGAPSGNFALTYEYNFANQAKSVTDQRSGTGFSTSLDSSGRPTGVSALGYGGVSTQFVTQTQYRAWGALKSVSYGNSTSLNLTYDQRLMVATYSEATVGTSYQYYADGRIKFAHDQSYNPQGIKDRAYQYDHAGRIAEAYSGAQARDFVNNANSGVVDGPFRQTYGHDVWDNVLSQSGRFWSRPMTTNSSYNSANRNTAWSYDAEGNVLSRNDGTTIFQAAQYGYDAAGESVSSGQSSTYYSASEGGWINLVSNNAQNHDGDGQLVKAADILRKYVNGTLNSTVANIDYQVRSTVLGNVVISEYTEQGAWQRTYVYAGSQRVGQTTKGETGSALSLWRHVDPVSGDELNTVGNGQWFGRTVLDPQGVNVGENDPFPPDGSGDPDGIVVSVVSDKTSPGMMPIEGGGVRCVLDGIEMDCGFIRGWSTQQCPDNDCGPRVDKDGHLTQPVQAFADGWYGNLPQGAIYEGNGRWFIYGGNRDSSLGKRRKERPEDGNYGLRRNHSTSQSPTPSPTPCPGSIPEAIGKQILAVASQEKIDPTLLSVTMRHESSFGTNTKANPRYVGKGRNRRIEGYDVGPMQLATNIWNKSPFTDGLSNPFGTIGFNIAKNQYDSFNGNFEENITVAARAFALDILPRSSSNADAAGKYRGPAGYQGRYNQYISEAPADRKQLNCIAGRK